jgi:antitoxin ParD1/3/4
MTRTMTIDTGEALRNFVEGLVESGLYKTNSEAIREGLRLLQEKQAKSKLEILANLIDEGESSGKASNWNMAEFINDIENHDT